MTNVLGNISLKQNLITKLNILTLSLLLQFILTNIKITIFGPPATSISSSDIDVKVTDLGNAFEKLNTNLSSYTSYLTTLKTAISGNTLQEVNIKLFTSTSEVADDNYNFYLDSYLLYLYMVNWKMGINGQNGRKGHA